MAKRTSLKTWLIISVIFAVLATGTITEGRTIYVDDDATGANNGSSWADAYNYLQDALADANSAEKPVEIRVAQGVYTPDSNSDVPDGTGDREATFHLINDVAIYGGFPTAGGAWEHRDPNVYETILSGDLNGNDPNVTNPADLPNEPNRADNSYHVVIASGTDTATKLDGFVITAGNANGVDKNRDGGGIYGENSRPTLANCTFSRNSAANNGGGIYCSGDSQIILTECTFTANFAKRNGGGMYNDYLFTSFTKLTDCIFTGNVAATMGGGICNRNSSITTTNCTFGSNSAGRGGGVYNSPDSNPTLSNCKFSGNRADIGGGVFNMWNNVTLTNCTFAGNTADHTGGAMYSNDSVLTVTKCIFSEHSAYAGGGLFNLSGRLTIINCSFVRNSASSGGGMYNAESQPVLMNCVFNGNSSADGGGIYNVETRLTVTNSSFSANSATRGSAVACDQSEPNQASYIQFNNCILWNGGDEVWNNDGSSITITYSNVEGGWAGPGSGNIESNPLFLDGDLRLSAASPCIDAGDNEADTDASTPGRLSLVGVDLDANLRFVDDPSTLDTGNGAAPLADMGAYEFGSPRVPSRLLVDASATALNNGTTWVDAFTDLELAVRTAAAAAGAVAEIWVAAGLYTPDSTVLDEPREATFRLVSGVTISGGFPLGGSDWHEREPNMHETVLSGDLNRDDGQNSANTNENSYHVITCIGANRSCILDGFTITGGKADGFHNDGYGAGMYNENGAPGPTLSNCQFNKNFAKWFGGAIYNYKSNPIVTNCTFNENSSYHGAGMNNELSSPVLTNCTFIENSAVNNGSGGGMRNQWTMQNVYNSHPTLTNCIFRNNSGGFGAGVANLWISPSFVGCVFRGNSAYEGGGMNNVNLSHPMVKNCTFSRNSARVGGGLHNISSSNSSLVNCTFAENSVELHGGGMLNEGSLPSVVNCVFWANSDWRGQVEGAQISTYLSIGLDYSCIQGWTGNLPGTGIISADPLFADPDNGDYHLKSQAGRWDPSSQSWVVDGVTSPCIDAGDPSTPIGLEFLPNGGIVNMGAYGGTAEASKSPAN